MLPASRSLLQAWRAPREPFVCLRCRRNLAQSAPLSSGHSRWSKIKHDKAKTDARKGTQLATVAEEIRNASRSGGANPALNPRLVTAIANAKRAGFSKSSIEGAIARGQGRSANGAALESVTIEAVSPPAALMIDIETDSKARVLQDLRVILKKYGAREGSAAYLFEKRGRSIFIPKDGVGIDEVFETAVEAGALDVEEGDEGRIVVDTEIESTPTAEKRIVEEMKLELDSSDTVWHPTEQVEEADQSICATLSKLQEELEDYDDVRAVYSNVLLVEDAAQEAASPA